MVKENAIAGENAVAFPVNSGYPVTVKLGSSVGTGWSEKSILCLALRITLPVELTG